MRFLLVLVCLAYLGACGYKGPLYLPESKTGATKPQAVVNPTPAIVHPGPAPDRPVPAEAAPAPK